MDYAMIDGVYHVWADETHEELLFAPPGSQYDFFTDMHNILKICAMGPVKTFCYHRMALLEQKFNLHCMLNADKEFLAQKVNRLDAITCRDIGVCSSCRLSILVEIQKCLWCHEEAQGLPGLCCCWECTFNLPRCCCQAAPHRDFYNVRKVDTHIHHSSCMHQKHLLRFIKSKLKKEPDEVIFSLPCPSHLKQRCRWLEANILFCH